MMGRMWYRHVYRAGEATQILARRAPNRPGRAWQPIARSVTSSPQPIARVTTFSGMAGVSGMNGAAGTYSIAPGADVDTRFSMGEAGIYVVRMVVENVRLGSETRSLHQTKPYNDALRAQGVNATVTAVRYVGNRNPRDANWAGSLLDEVFGTGGSNNVVADMLFDVTVRVDPMPDANRSPANPSDWMPEGMSGFGVVQIGAGAVFAVIGVIAIVLAVTFPGFGKMVLEGVRFVGNVAGSAVGGAAGALAENAVPILLAVGVIAGGMWLLKKGGGRYSKGSGFSFGG